MGLRNSNFRWSHDSYMGLLARLCLIVTIFLAPGCATTREGQSSSPQADGKKSCSRLVAAAHAYHKMANPNKITQKIMQRCDDGDPLACSAIPGAWPIAAYFEVVGALFVIPALAMDPKTQRACPQEPSTTEATAKPSDSQQIMEPSE